MDTGPQVSGVGSEKTRASLKPDTYASRRLHHARSFQFCRVLKNKNHTFHKKGTGTFKGHFLIGLSIIEKYAVDDKT